MWNERFILKLETVPYRSTHTARCARWKQIPTPDLTYLITWIYKSFEYIIIWLPCFEFCRSRVHISVRTYAVLHEDTGLATAVSFHVFFPIHHHHRRRRRRLAVTCGIFRSLRPAVLMGFYRGADKSLARPGRKQSRKHVRVVREFRNIGTWAVIKFLFSSSSFCRARRRRKFTPFWQKH